MQWQERMQWGLTGFIAGTVLAVSVFVQIAIQADAAWWCVWFAPIARYCFYHMYGRFIIHRICVCACVCLCCVRRCHVVFCNNKETIRKNICPFFWTRIGSANNNILDFNSITLTTTKEKAQQKSFLRTIRLVYSNLIEYLSVCINRKGKVVAALLHVA